VISPLLANIYLHYAFDLWVNVWHKKWAHGEVAWRGSTVELVLGTLLARGQSELRKAIRSASSCGVKTTPKRPS